MSCTARQTMLSRSRSGSTVSVSRTGSRGSGSPSTRTRIPGDCPGRENRNEDCLDALRISTGSSPRRNGLATSCAGAPLWDASSKSCGGGGGPAPPPRWPRVAGQGHARLPVPAQEPEPHGLRAISGPRDEVRRIFDVRQRHSVEPLRGLLRDKAAPDGVPGLPLVVRGIRSGEILPSEGALPDE